MNVNSAAPLSLPFNTANIPTEAVQTENRLAERIPESRQTYESVASRSNETGPGQTSGNQNSQQTSAEERPRIVGERQPDQENDQQSSGEDRQSQQQQRQEQLEIRELASIDRKVKAHEQAHSSVGGAYAGAPSFTYTTGPNGVRYAVAGEVPIDMSPIPGNPEATLRKAEQVARAALAPADPSPTDRRVAAAASALASKARYEITRAASQRNDAVARFNGDDENQETGPYPYSVAGRSLSGGQLTASLATDATQQVGGQVSASA